MNSRSLAISVAGSLLGCQPPELNTTPDQPVLRRDSVGVELVENSAPTWSDLEQWTLSESPLFRIEATRGGEVTGLLDPASIDVDDRGRIIVADGDQVGWHAILVFDSTGAYQFRMGGQGEGPGEFGQLWWAATYRGDSIVGFDMSGDRLNVYGPQGEFARQIRMPSIPTEPEPPGTYGFTAGIDAAYSDGWFLGYPFGALDVSQGVGPAWVKHLLVRLEPSAESWDSLGSFEIMQAYWDGTRQQQLWFSPFSQRLVAGDRLFFARGDRFEVKEINSTGELVRIIRRAHRAQPVTSEWRERLEEWYLERVRSSPEVNDAALERMRAELRNGEYTETLPATSALLAGPDGSLWVEEFRWFVSNERTPFDLPAYWSVFDSTGVWLGQVATPPHFALQAVTTDRALGFAVDEFGVKEVHVYALDRPRR